MNDSVQFTTNNKSLSRSKIKKGLSLSLQKRKHVLSTENCSRNSNDPFSKKNIQQQTKDKQNQQNKIIQSANHSNSTKKNKIKYVQAYNSNKINHQSGSRFSSFNKKQKLFKIIDQDIKLGGSKPKSRKLSLNTNNNTQNNLNSLISYESTNQASNLTNISYINNTISFGSRASENYPSNSLKFANNRVFHKQRKILRQSKVSKVSCNLLQQNLDYFKQIDAKETIGSIQKHPQLDRSQNKAGQYNFSYKHNDLTTNNSRFMTTQQLKREPFAQINLNYREKNFGLKDTTPINRFNEFNKISINETSKISKNTSIAYPYLNTKILSLPTQGCQAASEVSKSRIFQIQPLPIPNFEVTNCKEKTQFKQSQASQNQQKPQSPKAQSSDTQNLMKPLIQKLSQNPQKRFKNSTIRKLEQVQNQLDKILKQAYEARQAILVNKT